MWLCSWERILHSLTPVRTGSPGIHSTAYSRRLHLSCFYPFLTYLYSYSLVYIAVPGVTGEHSVV
jgi:hypothetical protein